MAMVRYAACPWTEVFAPSIAIVVSLNQAGNGTERWQIRPVHSAVSGSAAQRGVMEVSAASLGIDLSHDSAGSYKWLLASFLLGKRIRSSVALAAYHALVVGIGLGTPAKLASCPHRTLVAQLRRYRFQDVGNIYAGGALRATVNQLQIRRYT